MSRIGMFTILVIGLVISFTVTGLGISVNLILDEYSIANVNIGDINKSSEFQNLSEEIRTDIVEGGIDNVVDVFLVSFKVAPKIFKNFLNSIDVFQSMSQELNQNFGVVIPAWGIALAMSIIALMIILIALALFLGVDKVWG